MYRDHSWLDDPPTFNFRAPDAGQKLLIGSAVVSVRLPASRITAAEFRDRYMAETPAQAHTPGDAFEYLIRCGYPRGAVERLCRPGDVRIYKIAPPSA